MVWMRTAGMPNFWKLWGQINQPLYANTTYEVLVTNKYNVDTFQGQKFLVFSTTNAFGGKNEFLAICYLVVGGLCLVFALFFLIAHCKDKNKEAWPREE